MLSAYKKLAKAIIYIVDTVLSGSVGFRHLLWADAVNVSGQLQTLHIITNLILYTALSRWRVLF